MPRLSAQRTHSVHVNKVHTANVRPCTSATVFKNKQTNKAGVLRDDDDDNVAISSSLHISHFTGMAKKDPDQIATNSQEELGKEEQNPSSKQQRKEHQEQCRHSEKKRGLMRREREDGSCCHLLTSSLEKTAKRRAHTSKKPK